jgi:tripartite ATP-independent transporter DctM subunit
MILLLSGLAVFLILGFPIAFSVGLSAVIYFILFNPGLIGVIPQKIYAGFNSYSMMALPLYILMGTLMNSSGLTRRLINFSLLIVGRFRGGLAMVNVLVSMLFGGISGSSASDTASIGSVLIPEMEHRGYSRGFSSGVTVASSTMGMIIPPSIPMVLYSFLSDESVGKLFLAGLIPGVMIGVFQLIISMVISNMKNYPREEVQRDLKEKLTIIKDSSLALLMPLIVVGSVVGGIATATESAAIGVLYVLIVGSTVYKSISFEKIVKDLKYTITMTAKIMVIIGMSNIYIWILGVERVPEAVVGVVVALNLSPIALMLAIAVILLIIGTFMEVTPSILLLAPVLLPAVIAVGIEPIQLGVILVCGLGIGAVTPPVGMCINVCTALTDLGMGEIFKYALPFLFANLLTLLLAILIPAVSLWVPSMLTF